MKINMKHMTYEQVMALPKWKYYRPFKPSLLLHTVIRVGSIPSLLKTRFTYTSEGMEKVKKQPCLILMNHSSFTDLKVASAIFYPRPFGIVSTTDSFVGKEWLMRLIGCIPTQKFVSDMTLIRDMEYMLTKKKAHVLMFPEAGYSFDGTATVLPSKLGILLKKLNVPVISVITRGAFARDPLYNGLQIRKVPVSAHVKCLLTPEEIREKSVAQLDEIVADMFRFDNFAWQRDNGIHIKEDFRADGLERILYQCPHCGNEHKMEGKGTVLTCHSCGKQWEMDTLGQLKALDGETEYAHIPDWYAWQRSQVRQELESGNYSLETDVDIGMMVDYKALYMVGSGHLSHGKNGFRLTGCDGALDYSQGPLSSHCLNSDYFWYQIGDVIGIGNKDALYYCFPKDDTSVTKTRLAAEELYKMKKRRKTKVTV